MCLFLQVGFDDSGRISGILLNMYNNSGFVDNDNTFAGNFLYGFIDNGLLSDQALMHTRNVVTATYSCCTLFSLIFPPPPPTPPIPCLQPTTLPIGCSCQSPVRPTSHATHPADHQVGTMYMHRTACNVLTTIHLQSLRDSVCHSLLYLCA